MAQTKALLTRGREMELGRLWQTTGDIKAIDKLVTSHLRLVWKIVSGYKNYRHPPDDLFQEGCMGLMRAARKFDPNKNVRFSTFATSWICAFILKYLTTNHHGPTVCFGKTNWGRKIFFGFKKAKNEIEKTNPGEQASAEQIAQKLGVKTKQVELLMPYLLKPTSSLDSLDSLDALTFYDYDHTLRHYLSDAAADSPEDIVAKKEDDDRQRLLFEKCFFVLNAREQKIIRRRYLNKKRETLVGLGRALNISRERVRQIEEEAKKKMKEAVRAMDEGAKSFASP